MGKDKKQKRNIKIPRYVFDSYHVNLWTGNHLNRNRRYAAAIKHFQTAEGNATNDREMVPVYEGRSRAFLHTWNLKSTEQDVKEGLQLVPDNIKMMETRGKTYYQKNRFADALNTYYRGNMKKPKQMQFMKGIWASTGTIMNSLGTKAGNIMSEKRLGGVVVNMKMKELGLVKCGELSDEFEKKKRESKVERAKDAYNDIYLNRAAENEKALKSFLTDGTLFLGNKKQNKMIRRTLENALDKLNIAKDALWRKKPLFTREQDILSKRVKEFESKKHERKVTGLETVVNLRISALNKAFDQNNYSECFRIGDELRSFLIRLDEKDLPSKNDIKMTVINKLGDLLLKNKKLLPISNHANDIRLLVLLGFIKPQNLTHEAYLEAYHPRIQRISKFLKDKESDLNIANDPLEKAYLNHEIGVAYGVKNLPIVMRRYAKEAIRESRVAKNRTWTLNSLFLLVRSEILEKNVNTGRICLNGLITAATEFETVDFKFFCIRAYELTALNEFPKSELQEYEPFERKILKSMSNGEYLLFATRLLQKARAMPPEIRFPAGREESNTATRGQILNKNLVLYQDLAEADKRSTLQINLEQF